MSRKSDIASVLRMANHWIEVKVLVEAAYDLGRSAQAEKDARKMDTHECWVAECFAKRLRAKVHVWED